MTLICNSRHFVQGRLHCTDRGVSRGGPLQAGDIVTTGVGQPGILKTKELRFSHVTKQLRKGPK